MTKSWADVRLETALLVCYAPLSLQREKALERDYITGLLGIQLGYLSPEDLKTLTSEPPIFDEPVTLSRRLVRQGVLSAERAQALESLAEEVIEANGGDVSRAFETLGGSRRVVETLRTDDPSQEWTDDETVVAIVGMSSRWNEDAVAITSEHVGRYTYQGGDPNAAEIGRGGIGRVLVVQDLHLGREIAVKELVGSAYASVSSPIDSPSRLSATVDSIVRFLREARVTGQLEHPNIVPVYELGRRSDGTLYYTMKLVRGKTLAEVLAERTHLRERLGLLKRYVDLCQAIAYAHSRGVIHRDIKPQNVMLGEFGETVVLDWGLAKVAGQRDIREREIQREIKIIQDAQSGETVVGVAMGTPAYMSPEQAVGMLEEIDEQSDVWSLGAVLYEILTGRPPFDGKTVHEVLAKVATKAVVPPRQRDENIPPDLASVCEKALRRKKDNRYASAGQIATEIEAYLTGGRVGAYDYSSWELIKRLVLQNIAISTLVAVLFITLVSGSVAVFRAYREAESNRQVAEQERSEAEKQEREAVAARENEQEARIVAEQNEVEAHHNLSIALREEAARLVEAREYLSAKVYAAAALSHNPYNPRSAFNYVEPERALAPGGWEEIATLQSHLFQSEVGRLMVLDKMLSGHRGPVNSATFAPDGNRFVSGGADGMVRIWNTAKGVESFALSGHSGPIMGIAVSPDGRFAASSSGDRSVRIWDMVSRRTTIRLDTGDAVVNQLSFSPDGKTLAGGCLDGTVKLWGVSGLGEAASLTGHTASVRGEILFTQDGRRLVSGSVDGTIRLWNLDEKKTMAVLVGHDEAVYALALSNDGTLLASGGYDGTVRLWNAADGSGVGVFSARDGHVLSVDFSPDDALLVSGAHNGRIDLWSVADRELVMTAAAHAAVVTAVSFSPDGRFVASAGTDSAIRIWRMQPPEEINIGTGHERAVYRIAFSRDGKMLAAGCHDGAVSIWNWRTGEKLAAWHAHDGLVWSVSFSPDGRYLSTSSEDRTVRLWEIPGGTEAARIEDHDFRVYSAAFSPDGLLLASSARHFVQLWDVSERRERHRLTGYEGRIPCLAFSPDGSLLATADEQRLIKLWNVTDWELRSTLKGHDDVVSWVEFSGDGKTLLSSGKEGLVRLWDVESGALIRTLTGHGAWVNLVRFSPGGKLVLSGSDDNSVRLWDVASGRILQIQNLGHEVTGLAFAPAGEFLAVADETRIHLYPVTLDLWNRDPAELLKEAETEAGRTLTGFELRASQRE